VADLIFSEYAERMRRLRREPRSINQFIRQTDRFQAWLDEQGIPTTLSVESWQLEEYISGGLLQQPVAADARAGARLRGRGGGRSRAPGLPSLIQPEARGLTAAVETMSTVTEPSREDKERYAHAGRLAVKAVRSMPPMLTWQFDEEGRQRAQSVQSELVTWVADADDEKLARLTQPQLGRLADALSSLSMIAGLALEQAQTRGVDRAEVLAEIGKFFDRFENP